jgi:type IV pilus assembly protein PilM
MPINLKHKYLLMIVSPGGKVPQPIVGVDIGTTAVRGVHTSIKKGQPVVTHAAEIALPENVIVNGELKEPTVLSNALKLLWKTGKFPTKNVSIGIANQQTLVRQVDLPLEEDEDFKTTLPFKVSQDLPVDASELALDYYPLGDYVDNKGGLRRKALLVGAMNMVVENFTQAVSESKLKPVNVDFSGFALIRSAVFTAGDPKRIPGAPGPNEEYPCEVLVDVGSNMTIIAVHYEGRPLFVRLVQGGGDSVTRAIADHLSLRWEVADALKKTMGIGGVVSDKQTRLLAEEVPQENIPVVQQIINMMGSSLVQVVRESVDYYLAASPQITEITRVLLSGGGVMLPGYGERIASELRTNVGLLTPMEAFSAPKKAEKYAAFDPRFGLAFGLAIGTGE